NEPKRVCQVIELRKQFQDEYKQLHANTWPSILARLRASHITDYSIHFFPSPPYIPVSSSSSSAPPTDEIAGLLIATFKYTGSDLAADSAAIAADPETQRWWALTDGMQRSLVPGAKGSGDETGLGWWLDCEEVFRME
ncbi:rhamnose mutarotase, partial [Clavulina sp. PMI_390]